MEKLSTSIKKWGNSFGIIIPKNIIEKNNIREGVKVDIIIQPNVMTVGDIFQFAKKNKLKGLTKSTDQLMKEVDEELWFEE